MPTLLPCATVHLSGCTIDSKSEPRAATELKAANARPDTNTAKLFTQTRVPYPRPGRLSRRRRARIRFPARGLVTFGSPRVGDRDFRDTHPVPTWRVVNNNDLVCRIPPPVAYRHVGERVYIDRHGRTRLGTTRWERTVDEAAGHGDQAARVLEQWRRGERDAVVWDAIVDHSPLHYAIHAWNGMIDEEVGPAPST